MVEEVDHGSIEKYGIVDTDEEKINAFNTVSLRGLVEKPDSKDAPSNFAALGRYILSSKIFGLLEGIKPDVDGEVQLTDGLNKLLDYENVNALMTDADIYDCGNKLGYLSANLAVGMRDPKAKETIQALFNKFD